MGLVKRSDKVAFYGLTGSIVRMKGFTSFSKSSNPKEYTRQYVDEAGEQTDVVGFSPSYAYGFDQYTDNLVHADIATITDEEKLGDDATRYIYAVDFTNEISSGVYACKKRLFAVIPDSEGDSMDAYTYSGNLKNKGVSIPGTATVSNGSASLTMTFTPTSGAEYLTSFSVASATAQIAGADITINSQIIQTDANGIASIELPNGTYGYSIAKTGYTTVTGSITVSSAAEFVEETMTAA